MKSGHSTALLVWNHPPPDQLRGFRRASHGLPLSRLTSQSMSASFCLPENIGFRMLKSPGWGDGLNKTVFYTLRRLIRSTLSWQLAAGVVLRSAAAISDERERVGGVL